MFVKIHKIVDLNYLFHKIHHKIIAKIIFQNEYSFSNCHKQLDLKQQVHQTYEKHWFNQNHSNKQFKIIHYLYTLFKKLLGRPPSRP